MVKIDPCMFRPKPFGKVTTVPTRCLKKNMAVACCHSSATAVFLLGHSVCKVLDTIVQKLINFKDFKVCEI